MIRIYDLDLNLKAEIDDYESLSAGRKYYTFGETNLTINAEKQNVEEIQEDRIIEVNQDRSKIAIIKVIDREADSDETVKVTAYSLDFLFRNRVITPPAGNAYDSITAPAETAIKHYIDNCITNPVDPDRKMPQFALVTSAGQGATAEYNARYDQLDRFLDEIRSQQNIGIKFTLNLVTKKIDIDTYLGESHISGSADPVIFSTDYDNLISQKYYVSDVEEKNFAYVGGQGEAAARTIGTAGTETGINRKEMWVDTNQPAGSLTAAGETALANNKELVTFEGQVINRLPFIYETDFNLGDEVTITNKKWGVTLNTRITAVTEIYESSGFQLDIEFGNNIPELKEVINKKTKREVT
jgi:hypothetical protein